MTAKIVTWTKTYIEDLGTKDDSGTYDYAYTYFDYLFSSPGALQIKVRQYTETLDLCSLFFPSVKIDTTKDLASFGSLDFISAVINFLRTNFGATHFDFFNGQYNRIDLQSLPNNFGHFAFEQTRTTE